MPPLKFRGDDANLNCGYQDDDETGSGAINVTWFKDGVQFYHSVNQGLDVSITVSDVPGVQVDVSAALVGLGLACIRMKGIHGHNVY